MRNYKVCGRSLSITERQLGVFTGVARGGTLIVGRGAGEYDVTIASWSRLGFDRRPDGVDLISLMRNGALAVLDVLGRDQVVMTPLGRDVAQMMGIYSLSAMVHDPHPEDGHDVFEVEDRPPASPRKPSAPRVKRAIVDPITEPDPTLPRGVPEDDGHEAFTVTDREFPQEAPPAFIQPIESPRPAWNPPPIGDAGPARATDFIPAEEYVAHKEDSSAVKVPELPPPGAKLKVLQAFADEHGVDHAGLRSKAKVRAAIEAHFAF